MNFHLIRNLIPSNSECSVVQFGMQAGIRLVLTSRKTTRRRVRTAGSESVARRALPTRDRVTVRRRLIPSRRLGVRRCAHDGSRLHRMRPLDGVRAGSGRAPRRHRRLPGSPADLRGAREGRRAGFPEKNRKHQTIWTGDNQYIMRVRPRTR